MLSLEECRSILGYDQDVSDEAIEILRESLYLMADVVLDESIDETQAKQD